jgi:hypothetical protein
MIHRWLDDLARGWLQRRGYMVMPLPFVGLVIGNANGKWHEAPDGTEYILYLPRGHRRIVVSGSVLQREERA